MTRPRWSSGSPAPPCWTSALSGAPEGDPAGPSPEREKKKVKTPSLQTSAQTHTVTDRWTHSKPHLSVCNLLSSLHLVLHLSPHCLHFVLRCPSHCHLSGHLCVLRCRRAEKHTKIIETEAGSSVSVRSRRTELYLAFFFRKREEEVRLVCLTFLSRSA